MEHTAKTVAADGSTSPSLLGAVSDWQNHQAWVKFQQRYDPLVRRWCRGYGLDNDSVDEVCQCIWIELARRMKTFEYDPDRTFRGWLRRLCESRVVDFIRRAQTGALLGLDERVAESTAAASASAMDLDGSGERDDDVHFLLCEEGAKIQAAVKARVKPIRGTLSGWSLSATGRLRGRPRLWE